MQESGDRNEAYETRFQWARNYFRVLARRAEANPEAVEVFSQFLGERIAENWEPALEAAMQAAEALENAQWSELDRR